MVLAYSKAKLPPPWLTQSNNEDSGTDREPRKPDQDAVCAVGDTWKPEIPRISASPPR